MAVTQPFQKRNGYKLIMVTVICNGHFPTEKIVRSGVTVMQRPWPLVKDKGIILVSGRLLCNTIPGIISAFCKLVIVTKESILDLGH